MIKLRKGDLVKIVGLFESENLSGVVINGPYPAVFTVDEDGIKFSEETLAVDLVCLGRVYSKVKCEFLEKVFHTVEHSNSGD